MGSSKRADRLEAKRQAEKPAPPRHPTLVIYGRGGRKRWERCAAP